MRISGFLLASVVSAVVGAALGGAISGKVVAQSGQDFVILDRRINMLEQRMYSIESNLRSLEQRTMMQRPTSPQSLRDPDVDRLLIETGNLTNRIKEVECGLVHLDERTLPPNARKTGAPRDSCRLNPNEPVRISNRP